MRPGKDHTRDAVTRAYGAWMNAFESRLGAIENTVLVVPCLKAPPKKQSGPLLIDVRVISPTRLMRALVGLKTVIHQYASVGVVRRITSLYKSISLEYVHCVTTAV